MLSSSRRLWSRLNRPLAWALLCASAAIVPAQANTPTPAIAEAVGLGEPWDLQLSPSDPTLLTHGPGGAFLFDSATGERLRAFLGHFGVTSAAIYSPDGALVYTAGYDGRILKWDLQGQTGPERVALFDDAINGLCVSPSGDALAAALDNGSLAIVALSPSPSASLYPIEPGERLKCAAFSPDGARIACAGTGGTLFTVDASSGAVLFTATEHSSWIYDVAFSPDGALLASASDDHTARLWDTADGTLLATREDLGLTRSASFSSDSAVLATATVHGSKLWSTADPTPLHSLKGHGHVTRALRFRRSDDALFSLGLDGVVIAWDPNSGAELSRFDTMHHIEISSARASLDGTQLALRYRRLWRVEGSSLRLYDLQSGLWTDADETLDTNWDTTTSPSGLLYLEIQTDGTVHLKDAASNRVLRVLDGHSLPIHSTGFVGADDRGFTASIDGRVALYDFSALPPQDLVATPGVASIELSWSPVTGDSEYRVYRGQSDRLFQAELLAQSLSESAYSDASAAPGIAYYYWVEARVPTETGSTGVASPAAASLQP